MEVDRPGPASVELTVQSERQPYKCKPGISKEFQTVMSTTVTVKQGRREWGWEGVALWGWFTEDSSLMR